MATCSSLHRFFENPLPEKPTLLESLAPWNQIIRPVEQHSFTEIFGELHFKEKPEVKSPSLSPPSSSPVDRKTQPKIEILSSNKNPSLDSVLGPRTTVDRNHQQPKIEILCSNKNPALDSVLGPRRNKYAGSKNSESLQLCTEGLGFESSDEVEDSMNEMGENRVNSDVKEKPGVTKESPENLITCKRLKTGGGFPPPISCIGRSGKPWVCFRSYRHNGRFVLREIRIPNQELLHACREGGRLKLHFIHADEISDEQRKKKMQMNKSKKRKKMKMKLQKSEEIMENHKA